MIYCFLNIINKLFSYFCKDPPILDSADFPWSSLLRTNQELIAKEYHHYQKEIPEFQEINEYTAGCKEKGSWKTLFLRIFNIDTAESKEFPITMALLKDVPCTLAFFSIFEPMTKLDPHVGVYKGVIRYHLPISIPKDMNKCFINVAGRVLNWEIGKDLIFDDMFVHYAENKSSERRVILFLDIKRDFKNVFLNALNTLLLYFVKSNDVLLDTVEKANKFANKQNLDG